MSDRELINEVIHVPWNLCVWIVDEINTIEKGYGQETIFLQGFEGEEAKYGYGSKSKILVIADGPLPDGLDL